MGARVVLTRSDVGKGHPEYYQDLAARIARETPGAYFINQFGNPANPLAHEDDDRARDLGADGPRRSTRSCAASASAARSPGCRASSRASRPNAKSCWPIPRARCSRDYMQHRASSTPKRLVAGRRHRRGFHPADRRSLAREEAYTINDEESFLHRARAAARRKASSPARPPARCSPRRCAIAASRRRRSAWSRFVCDTGNKYLSKVYNDYWMLDQGCSSASSSATCAT